MNNNTTEDLQRQIVLIDRIEQLCETLRAKQEARSPRQPMTYGIDPTYNGPKFIRIVSAYGDSPIHGRTVHAFVARDTGDLIKAAGWKAPAKRKNGLATVGSLLNDEDFTRILTVCDPFGAYLYAR